ncbi:MAG: SRPBCC domain-containing protein [Anaerolineae bacterium]|nr:SRPBCC domain-containing protein [Anaerolineae bacterium]
MSESTLTKDTLVIERFFDAPVALIWQLWTQPDHFKNWYGPEGFTTFVAKMDLRIGGQRLICMETQTPDGSSMKIWTGGEYTEIVPNERLVYIDSLTDENGNVVSPSAYGMPDDHPATTEVTVLLEDLGGRTKMIMTHVGVPAEEQGANEGWRQSFAKLARYIETVLNNA